MMPIKGNQATPLNRLPSPEEQDQKLKEVSQLYEKQFLREMVKAMRSTVSESSLIQVSQGEKIFREQLDQQYVEQWGDKGGIGLGDMIYKQLIEKFGEALGITQVDRPHGPITFNEKSNLKPAQVQSPKFKLNYELQPAMSDREVTSPWAGVLTRAEAVEGNQLLEVKHDNGLSSRLNFKGRLEGLSLGDKIEAGQKLGSLNVEAQSVFWGVE